MNNEAERIEYHFRQLTERFLDEAKRKLTLSRASGDAEGAVREHVKIEVMQAAVQMFEGAHKLARRERDLPPRGRPERLQRPAHFQRNEE